MNVTVIKPKVVQKERLRVAAYCRVSTDHADQETSIENQIDYYQNLIQENPDYDFAGIYYDHGVSGYKKKRPGFEKMMEAAREGKMDLIMTKSITRFARNTETVLKATRELKELGIGVFFELQNMNTLSQEGELLMTIYAAFAQGESESNAELAKMTWKRYFSEGNPPTCLERVYGFCAGKKKRTVEIVPKEAKIVHQIFEWLRDDYDTNTILRMCQKAGYKKRGGKDFAYQDIARMLHNVSYKGDYIMQKTFINEDGLSRVNTGQLPKYYVENHHPAIVSRELWEEANDVYKKRMEEKNMKYPRYPITEENYPYKNKLHCGYCGEKMHYTYRWPNEGPLGFFCPRKIKADQGRCPGLYIPQRVVESWPEITENIFIKKDPDKPVHEQFTYCTEKEWLKENKKSGYLERVPYTQENFWFYKRIFCASCGWPLYRRKTYVGRDIFVCGGNAKHKKAFCKGVTIPLKVMQRLPKKDGYFLLMEEKIDGKKNYRYSCQKEVPERKKFVRSEETESSGVLPGVVGS